MACLKISGLFLVTIFSFPQLLHAQYGGNVAGMPVGKLPPTIKGLDKYIRCDVCREVSSYLFFTFERYRSAGVPDLTYDTSQDKVSLQKMEKVTEDHVMAMTEKVCMETDRYGDWLTRYDLRQDGGILKLINRKRYGVRSRITATIAQVCSVIMQDYDTTIAEMMWLDKEMPRSKLTRKLCNEFSDSCVKPAPKYPGKFNATGDIPSWQADTTVEVEKKDWYRAMEDIDGDTMSKTSMNSYTQQEINDAKYGVKDVMDDDDDEDEDEDWADMDEEERDYRLMRKAEKHPERMPELFYAMMEAKGHTKKAITRLLKKRGKSVMKEQYWQYFDFELGDEKLVAGLSEMAELEKGIKEGYFRMNEELGRPEINPEYDLYNPYTPERVQALWSVAKQALEQEAASQKEDSIKEEKRKAKREQKKNKGKGKKKGKKRAIDDDELRRLFSRRRMLRASHNV